MIVFLDDGRRVEISDAVILNDNGLLAWRRGTGDNVEITWLRAAEKRVGCGTRLIRDLLLQLKDQPPYYSIYGFTRGQNNTAQAFYIALGFQMHRVDGIYREGMAYVFRESYEYLCRRHLTKEDRGE
jgi:ribosomal protein S18 acetylase RimI-like enzyme